MATAPNMLGALAVSVIAHHPGREHRLDLATRAPGQQAVGWANIAHAMAMLLDGDHGIFFSDKEILTAAIELEHFYASQAIAIFSK